jgi:hypothetical protein
MIQIPLVHPYSAVYRKDTLVATQCEQVLVISKCWPNLDSRYTCGILKSNNMGIICAEIVDSQKQSFCFFICADSCLYMDMISNVKISSFLQVQAGAR